MKWRLASSGADGESRQGLRILEIALLDLTDVFGGEAWVDKRCRISGFPGELTELALIRDAAGAVFAPYIHACLLRTLRADLCHCDSLGWRGLVRRFPEILWIK